MSTDSPEIASWLLEHGANPNARTSHGSQATAPHCTTFAVAWFTDATVPAQTRVSFASQNSADTTTPRDRE